MKKKRKTYTKINSLVLILTLKLSKCTPSDRIASKHGVQVKIIKTAEDENSSQKSIKMDPKWLQEDFTPLQSPLQPNRNTTSQSLRGPTPAKNQSEIDKDILGTYELSLRRGEPKAMLLKGDRIALMVFDFVKYPELRNNVTVNFSIFVQSYQRNTHLYFDPRSQKYAYFMVDSTKMGRNNNSFIQIFVNAKFMKGNQSIWKHLYTFCQVYLVDKYKPSEHDFQGFKTGYKFLMRSQEDKLPFPLNHDHITANLLDIQLEQVTASGSTIVPKNRQIETKISPKVTTKNLTYFENMDKINVTKIVAFTNKWSAMVVQRIDKPEKFQIRVYWFEFSGEISRRFTATVNDFEFVRSIKINSYFHIFVANYRFGSLQIFCRLKMENTTQVFSDVPPGVFYPDSSFDVQKMEQKLSSFDLLWINNEVAWFFSLEKADVTRQKDGQYLVMKPQRIYITSVYMKAQKLTRDYVGSFLLDDITNRINAKIMNPKNFSHSICNKVRAIQKTKIVLRCRLFDKSPEDSSSHLIYATIGIKSWGAKGSYVVEYVFSPPITNYSYLTSCFINLKRAKVSPAVQKYIIQPFIVAFYEESKGLFMLSLTNEYIQLLDISEVEKGTKLSSSICDSHSRTMTLMFTKNTGENTRGEDRNKIEEILWVFNMDSKMRGNDRVITTLKRVLPIRKVASLHMSSMYRESREELIIGSTFYVGGFKLFFIRTKVDLGYPRITLSLNSTESFQTSFKVYTNKYQQERGISLFNFSVNVTTDRETTLNYSAPLEKLKNGKYNLEKYLRVKGPLKSLQFVNGSQSSPRVQITPRLAVIPFSGLPNEEYEHVELARGELFLGITSQTMVLYHFKNKTFSYRDYSMKLKWLETACCSKNPTYYFLFYDASLVNPFIVEKYEVLYFHDQSSNSTTPYLFSRWIKPIDTALIEDINLRQSKQFLRSIADRMTAMIVFTKDIVRVIIIEESDEHANVVVYDDRDYYSSVIAYLGKDISAMYLDTDEDFEAMDVISVSQIAREVRTMLLVIGTQTRVTFKYVHFTPPTKVNVSVTMFGGINKEDQPGNLEFVHCSKGQKFSDGGQNYQINSVCKIVLNSYIMKELLIKTGYYNVTSQGSINERITMQNTRSYFMAEYYLPKDSRVDQIIESEGYIGVLVINTLYYHKSLLIYKRGLGDVWSSIYIGYDTISTFEMEKLDSGVTIVILKEEDSDVKVYQVGNMTLEIKDGYDKVGKFEVFYTAFENSSLVSTLKGSVPFAEHLVVPHYIFLYIYGFVGSFFGFFVLLWFCCCLWRCIYVCCIRRVFKTQKEMIPILVKVKTTKLKTNQRKEKLE